MAPPMDSTFQPQASTENRGGDARSCSDCGARAAVVWSDELAWEETLEGLCLSLHRLSGETCRRCGAKWFDASSFETIERYRHGAQRSNYEAKVSNIGGSAVGIYIPKDLRRQMDLEPKMQAFITKVSNDAMFIRVVRPGEDISDPGMDAIDGALGL